MTALLTPAMVLLRLASGLVIIWGLGFLMFVGSLPGSVDDLQTHTDAIVVLTGGRDRLGTGIELLHANMAERLFISGVPKGVDGDDILRQSGHQQDSHDSRIHLGHRADDTKGNAAESAQWVREQSVASIRLVTGAYHMPRALLEFRQAMPQAVIIPHPVFPSAVKSREWWRWPGTAALLATEYTKTMAAMVRHWFISAGRFDP